MTVNRTSPFGKTATPLPASPSAACHTHEGAGLQPDGLHAHDQLEHGAESSLDLDINPSPFDLPGVRTPVAGRAGGQHTRRVQRDLARAEAMYERGEPDAAVAELTRLSANTQLSAHDRGTAALALAAMVYELDRDTVRAEIFLLEAERLAPSHEGIPRLRFELLAQRGEIAEALRLAEALIEAHPHDAQLLRRTAALLLSDSQLEAGLEMAEQALELASAADDPHTLRPARMTYALALRRSMRVDEAVHVYRTMLADNPRDVGAHRAIAEFVLPDFDHPRRAEIDAMFAQANVAYRASDFERIQALALRILEIDPNDGLAHRMYATANDEVVVARRFAEPPLFAQIGTPEQRSALIRHFEAITARAQVDTPPRTGRPDDLFPEWRQLNEIQRATLAYSVLGYGELIPAAMEQGARYHLVHPGTSGADVDARVDRDQKNAFGRHYWAIGGWQRSGFVVTGVHRLDGASRGGYNTITHEFAHLVHWHMRTVRQRRERVGAAALTSRERHLADAADIIERLYARAMAGRQGQRLLDPYSGNTDREYFAQGMMAYLNPHGGGTQNAQRLFSRNPELWHFVRELAEAYGSFPEAVPATVHPPAGQNALGSPFALARVAQHGTSPALKRLARSTLEELTRRHQDAAGARPERATTDLLLLRAGELAAIDLGLFPVNYMSDPEAMLQAMGPRALQAQLEAEQARVEELVARGLLTPGQRLEHRRTLSALGRQVGRTTQEATLNELRTEILQAHRALSSFTTGQAQTRS